MCHSYNTYMCYGHSTCMCYSYSTCMRHSYSTYMCCICSTCMCYSYRTCTWYNIVHTCVIVIVHAYATVLVHACATYQMLVVQIWFANFIITSCLKQVFNQKHDWTTFENATHFDIQHLFQTVKPWKTNGFLMSAIKNHCKTYGFLILWLFNTSANSCSQGLQK